jgi:hypothetical protein
MTGCGTFLYSERCFQPHSHQIDWKIVALNSLGLILFFIPGVIAFVVDFWTGAIYLPCEYCHPPVGHYVPPPAGSPYVPMSSAAPGSVVYVVHKQPTPQLVGLKRIALAGDERDTQGIERVVSRHIGRAVSLDDHARLSRLGDLEQYGEHLERHRTDRRFGEAVRSFFDRLTGA